MTNDPADREPLLQMRNIRKRFGATVALNGVNLRVFAGEILALIGENGAGKSTLMKVLSGALAPDDGEMSLKAKPFAPVGPHAARLAGVAMIYQELNLAPDLNVVENVMLGQERHRGGWLRRGEERLLVREALARLGHEDLPLDAAVGTLSPSLQQIVEIARALVGKADILVLDEPTSSLSQADVEHLFQVLRRLKQSGMGIIYISHFLEEIRRVADRFAVLRDGESVGEGILAGAGEEQIVTLMVGRKISDLFPKVPHQPGEAILSLENLSGMTRPTNVSLELCRGEILGIAGLIGAGRTELLRCLYGLDPIRQGKVTVARVQTAHSPRARIRAGLGFVSEDRKQEGLAQNQSIADNMSYSRLRPYQRFGWLTLSRRSEAVREWMSRLSIKARHEEQPVSDLSGGNQQKVALARVLHQEAEVLLLDEPTRGIDVGTKADIYRLIGRLAAEGKAVIFVSSYTRELLEVCDRVAVMSRGRICALREAASWTEEEVIREAIAVETI